MLAVFVQLDIVRFYKNLDYTSSGYKARNFTHSSHSLIAKMKPLLIMFCCLAIVVCEEEVSEGCDPWPSNVRSTRECCLIPHHSNDLIQDMCAMQCFSHGSQENECPTNCYINKTKILKEGTIDKTVVKRFYHNNNVYFDHDWKKFIDLGVDKCEFASSDSVTQSLLSFFNCVSDFLANNCISFLQVPECVATEDLFDKCRKDPANCSKWPNTLMHPASCCNTPQLENEGIKLECRVACERKELFVAERNKCIDKCVDASIQSEGKIDFELVKKVLIESSKKVEAWEKPIASAVEACEKDMKGEL